MLLVYSVHMKLIKDWGALKKQKAITHVLLAALFLFLAMAVIGLRFFYPYHFFVSLPFLALAVMHTYRLFRIGKSGLTKTKRYGKIQSFVFKYHAYFFVLLFVLLSSYIISRIIPSDQHPFENLSDAEVVTYVRESLDLSILHLDRLEITAQELVESGLLKKNTLTANELATIGVKWNAFLDAVRDSEEVTDIHRYFPQISYFTLQDSHAKSFTISYSLYLKKYEMFGIILETTGNNERVIKALNEHSSVFGGKNSYAHIRERYVDKDSFLRRNLGRGYGWFLEQTVDTSDFGEDYNALVRSSKNSYRYIITHLPKTAGIIAQKYQSDVENSLFKGWFPIQMNVADAMGKVHLSMRHTTFITREQVAEMRPSLQPGDILIERRNWHLSNVGIPGFWPHAALHLGTLSEADKYFSEIFPYEGYKSFSELLQNRHPVFYENYTQVTEEGDPYAVIEGLAAGIILQSLEKSAMADYVGVLRPLLTKEEKLKSLVRAIGNFGKPYDYNFDFETRDEIVCSELVYDAYLPHNDSRGVNFELAVTSGRKMISPNMMVEKFYREQGTEKQELEFVYFLDGNEQLEKAFVKNVDAFMESWKRSKFSNLQE